MRCKHDNDVRYCVQCKLDAMGVKFFMPPDKKRAVTLYDARVEFYELYATLNKEKFNGELPWVKIYLNGRQTTRTNAKIYWGTDWVTKKVVRIWFELADRMPTTCAPSLLHEMCHLKQLLETGSTDDKNPDFHALCESVGAPINGKDYENNKREELNSMMNVRKV